MSDPSVPVDEIISTLGGLTKAAEVLGVNRPSVIANWRTRGRVPAPMVLAVSRATGISPERIRPDIFQSKEDAA